MKKFFRRLRNSFSNLSTKKHHVEFFTAILTIPVLLTVIILNVTNLKNNQKPAEKTTDSSTKEVIINVPTAKEQQPNNSRPVNPEQCNKTLPQITISQPEEDQIIKENPVNIEITYKKDGYCAIVWAYRVNGARWSEFDDKSIALYNPPTGKVLLELKVKSVVTAEEKLLKREFSFQGSSIDTTPTKSASSSASL